MTEQAQNKNYSENTKGHKIQGIDSQSFKIIGEFQSINEAIKFLNVNLHEETIKYHIRECLKKIKNHIEELYGNIQYHIFYLVKFGLLFIQS